MPKDKPAPIPRPTRLMSLSSARQALRRARHENVFVQLALFALFMTALLSIITAGFDVRDDALVADAIGAQARSDVRATREFVFTDRDARVSDALREQVAESVPPVYDWDESLAERRREAIRKAFAVTRAALAERLRGEVVSPFAPAPAPTEGDPDKVGPRAPLTDAQIIEAATPAEREAFARPLYSSHFLTHFPGKVAPNDYDALARDGFTANAESSLTEIVLHTMDRMIVSEMRTLDPQRTTGIYLRRMRDGEVLIEYRLSNLSDTLVDLDAAPILARAHARTIGAAGELGEAVTAAASSTIEANTTLNPAETQLKREAAARAVSEEVTTESFYVGQPIVRAGEVITDRHLRIYDAMKAAGPGFSQTQEMLGLALFITLALVIIFRFARDNLRGFELEPRDVDFLAITLLISAVLIRSSWALASVGAEQLGLPVDVGMGLVPIAASAMLVRLMLRAEHAVMFALVLSVIAGLIWHESLAFAALTLLSCLVASTMVGKVKDRMALMQAGLYAGIASSGAVAAWLLLHGDLLEWSSLLYVSLSLGGGLLAGFFVLGTLPLFEYAFEYTTDIKLLELADLDHPLLRELIVKAPGSYHHSMMVGSLCEAAAEAIGCNALLARVGSYYHDIGKTKNPGYFAENQRKGENPHDRLKPSMSAKIIRNHVTDGVKMAQAAGLPREIIDFIAQHHGTKLIAYFYHKATQQTDAGIESVDESMFRYPGPKPQTREAAICLLADGIEAASRAMSEPTPDKLKVLVQNMINHAFTEGQLDDCDLTLKDLNAIADAFMRILKGIYHHRPKYPSDKKKPQKPAPKPAPAKDAPAAKEPPAEPAPAAAARAGKTVTPMLGTPTLTATASSADPPEEQPRAEHADRDEPPGDGDTPPVDDDDRRDDPKQGRAPLPRLGSS